jgi:hypothetical protein
VSYGGRHQRSSEEYHAIPTGWDAASVVAEHAALTGTHPIEPVQVPEAYDAWVKYRRVLYNIADGVRTDDPACVELAARFIELHFIGSYAGFLGSLLARRLKHATLASDQRQRLHAHFSRLVVIGERTQEFKDYLGLWRMLLSEADREALRSQVEHAKGSEVAEWLMARLKAPASTPCRQSSSRADGSELPIATSEAHVGAETAAKPAKRTRGWGRASLFALVAALAMAVTMAFYMVRKGAGDIGFIVAMALCAVIATLLVAPGLLEEGGDKAPWERSRDRKSGDLRDRPPASQDSRDDAK